MLIHIFRYQTSTSNITHIDSYSPGLPPFSIYSTEWVIYRWEFIRTYHLEVGYFPALFPQPCQISLQGRPLKEAQPYQMWGLPKRLRRQNSRTAIWLVSYSDVQCSISALLYSYYSYDMQDYFKFIARSHNSTHSTKASILGLVRGAERHQIDSPLLILLVGGFNPPEKCQSIGMIIIPNTQEK